MNHPTDTNAPETPAPLEPPADGMTWEWLAWQMRSRGNDFIPPPHLRGLALSYVEAKAREEGRAAREAKEAKESARRIAEAPKSIERALLDGPKASAGKAQAVPAQRGWRLRVRFLNHLRRCSTFREAAARIGVDESTARRWRAKYPAFAVRCAEIVAQRHAENGDDLKLRAGQSRARPYFFRGKRMGEETIHDDRALMFLLKLEDGRQARAEAREEKRLQREHEIRLKEMEIEARRELRAAEPEPAPSAAPRRLSVAAITEAHYRWKAQEAARQEAERQMHASAAHPASPADGDSSSESSGFGDDPCDIRPPQVVEVSNRTPLPR